MTTSRSLLVLALLLSAAALAGPGDDLRTALADLDTDLLHDRAVPLAGLYLHDGSAEAPPVTAAIWRQLVHELRLASARPPVWPNATGIRDQVRAATAAGLVPVGVVDLNYETLRSDVIDRGLLTVVDGRFQPTVTHSELTTQHRAAAAAALTPDLHHGAATRFVIPADLLITDRPITVTANFADGKGWQILTPDQPVLVHYDTTGKKTVRIRLTDLDGSIALTRFPVNVIALDTPAPTEVWPLTASISHDGAAATGEAFIYLAEGHAQLTEPVVVVEGFDLDNSLGWDELYELLNQENLLEDLRAAGRDAVILNFTEATDPIQRNAYLLVELLQMVENQCPAPQTYPLIGASMGGLVSRFALAWLEHEGPGHRCSLFISFDAPHTGADIPLGLQCWLEFFQGESEDAAHLLSRLDTPAARQMLLYHHTALDGFTALPDPAMAALAADLAALGDWPAAPRLVAVVNGSGTGLDQGFAPGAQLIDYEYGSLLVDIVGNVWAVPDATSQVIFDGLIDLIWPLPDTQRTVTVSGTLPWDGAPGGFRASLAEMDTTAVPYGDITALHDNHAFVPTVNALALAGVDPFFDLAGVPDLPALTPFDAVYIPATNQEHVAITAESRVWFLDEIIGDATAVGHGPELAALQLQGAVPNPFNPRTEIAFATAVAGPVHLWIVDARGRRIRDLLAGEVPRGRQTVTWNGRDQAGRTVAAGVYLAVLEQNGAMVAKRLTLVR